MFWKKEEAPYEPIVQVQKKFVPALYICGMNTPECTQLLIDKETFTIGSGPDNDGVLEFPGLGLSRQHCRIECGDNGYTLTDLKSTNGTYVNGKRLLPGVETSIKSGDQIRLGMSVFTVEEIIQEDI